MVPLNSGTFMAITFGITDNDTYGMDEITGYDIVANVAAGVASCTCDIVLVYDRVVTTEATGWPVGNTVSDVGTVRGVEHTSAFETFPSCEKSVRSSTG